jgi:hypothetical protein
MLRQWKALIIYLQESRLEFITNSVVRSLWECHHVNWCYSASRRGGGNLLMSNRRVVEKIEECAREFTVACPFEISKMDGFSWAFVGIVIEDIYRRNWLACLVGGACHSALGMILMSSTFLVKDWVKLVFVPLMWIFWSLF